VQKGNLHKILVLRKCDFKLKKKIFMQNKELPSFTFRKISLRHKIFSGFAFFLIRCGCSDIQKMSKMKLLSTFQLATQKITF